MIMTSGRHTTPQISLVQLSGIGAGAAEEPVSRPASLPCVVRYTLDICLRAHALHLAISGESTSTRGEGDTW